MISPLVHGERVLKTESKFPLANYNLEVKIFHSSFCDASFYTLCQIPTDKVKKTEETLPMKERS